MTIGDRLRYLREQKKLTQKQLAEKLKMPNQNISNYERGFRQPDYETLQTFADFYEVTTDYLLGRSENKKSDWDSKLPGLTTKDERDIAKKLENILGDLSSDTGLAFDGEPMDDTTRELVKAQIESNLKLAKQLAKKKFTPKKYRKDDGE